MSILGLLLTLVLIGFVVWAITTYVPMDAGIKRVIQIVGVVIAVILVLNAFGVVGGLSETKVPTVR